MTSEESDETTSDSPGGRAETSLESAMMGEHGPITERLLAHRIALMEGDLPAARRHYRAFRDLLSTHLEFENHEILPLYRELWDESNESPPRQFEAEHAKLLRISDAIGERLDAIEGRPEERLELLDAQTFLRSLIEHHDLREGRILYPFLSRKLDPMSQAAILARLARTEDAVDDQ